MDWREFAASVIQSLAWPASVATIAWMLRRQLSALLDGPVKRWKAGPVEMEFWERETAGVIDNVVGQLAQGAQTDDLDEELTRLAVLAGRVPVAAVTEGFRLVEREIRRIARNAGLESIDRTPVSRIILMEAERGLVTPETVSAVNGLATLRNLAAHDDGSGRSITPARAQEYVVLVQGVLFALSRSPAVVGNNAPV